MTNLETRAKTKHRKRETENDLNLSAVETDFETDEILDEEIVNHNRQANSKNLQKWLVRLGVILAIGLISLAIYLYLQLPMQVAMIQPKQATITETIASSGRVGGTTETNVGAQSQGIVQKLFVKEGDDVVGGQPLALIKNDVAEAQISQAQAAVNTARSQLSQASRGSLASDIDAVYEQVRQANAQVEQQRAAIIQAEKGVEQARSQLVAIRSGTRSNQKESGTKCESG